MTNERNELHQGPLAGLRVLEFAGIGPGPHCAMLLSDLGAEVIRIEREGGNGWPNPVVDRGRNCLSIDIRTDAGREQCLKLIESADVLIEGFRPGVMERLGLGPEQAHCRNPRLVYGRMTGWGQTGPLAAAAGHDINYLALTGALAAMGNREGPAIVPLNLLGDFGGGAMYLAFGIMAALWECQRSGLGQVVDAAIVDGVSSMMAFFSGLLPSGRISLDRDKNLLAGAAPHYRCYTCADGLDIALGPLEPQFLEQLMQRIDAPQSLREGFEDRSKWEQQSQQMAEIFATRSQAQWCALLEGGDACFTPVLRFEDAVGHPHMHARGVYQEIDGVLHVAPAPRFSRTPGAIRTSKASTGEWGWRP